MADINRVFEKLDKLIEGTADQSAEQQRQTMQVWKSVSQSLEKEEDLGTVLMNLQQSMEQATDVDESTREVMKQIEGALKNEGSPVPRENVNNFFNETAANTGRVIRETGNAISDVVVSIKDAMLPFVDEVLGEVKSDLIDPLFGLTQGIFGMGQKLFGGLFGEEDTEEQRQTGLLASIRNLLRGSRETSEQTLDFWQAEEKEEDRMRRGERGGIGGILGEVIGGGLGGLIGIIGGLIGTMAPLILGGVALGLASLGAAYIGEWLADLIPNFSDWLREKTMGWLVDKGIMVKEDDYWRFAGTRKLEEWINKLDPRNWNIPQEMKERGIINVLLEDLWESLKGVGKSIGDWARKDFLKGVKEFAENISELFQSLIPSWEDIKKLIRSVIPPGTPDFLLPKFLEKEETKQEGEIKSSSDKDKVNEMEKMRREIGGYNMFMGLSQPSKKEEKEKDKDKETTSRAPLPTRYSQRPLTENDPPDEVDNFMMQIYNKHGMR